MDIYLITDYCGRQILGKVDDTSKPVITVLDPILLMERPDPRTNKVGVGFAPILYNFTVDKIDVRWTTKFKVHNKLIYT